MSTVIEETPLQIYNNRRSEFLMYFVEFNSLLVNTAYIHEMLILLYSAFSPLQVPYPGTLIVLRKNALKYLVWT